MNLKIKLFYNSYTYVYGIFDYEIPWFYQDFKSENLCFLNMNSVHAEGILDLSPEINLSCPKGTIHKGRPHIRRGRGLGKSGQMRTEGGAGVVNQMWKSAWKKNIATIFVKFTQTIWQYVCI